MYAVRTKNGWKFTLKELFDFTKIFLSKNT